MINSDTFAVQQGVFRLFQFESCFFFVQNKVLSLVAFHVLGKTLKGIDGMRLDNQKVLRALVSILKKT